MFCKSLSAQTLQDNACGGEKHQHVVDFMLYIVNLHDVDIDANSTAMISFTDSLHSRRTACKLTLVHDIFTVHGKVQRISKSWKVCTMFSSSENKDTQSLSFSMALQASPSSQRSRLILLGKNQNHIMLFLHIAESVRGRCPRPPLCKIPNM